MAIHHKAEQTSAGILLNFLCRVLEQIAIFMLLLTTGLIALQIIARNFFEKGLPWVDELARYGGLGIVFLAVPLLLLNNSHISVDLVSSRLKGRSARVLGVLSESIVLLFCVFFLVGGYEFLKSAGRFVTPAMRWPNLLFYLPAMVGILFFTIVAIRRFWCVLKLGNATPWLNDKEQQP